MKNCVQMLCVLCLFMCAPAHATQTYVGTQTCMECHEEEHSRFLHSGKASSWKKIKKMQPKLTPEEFTSCFRCHTTGHGQPGGFVDITSTPDLANLGCETCHGPLSDHAESGDPDDIPEKPELEHCFSCHKDDRVKTRKFTGLLYSGGH